MMKCLVINLDRDVDRMNKIANALAPYDFLSVRRLSAVPGSTLPDFVCEQLAKKAEMSRYRGAIGCSLSHVASWEMIARNGWSHTLILEDDSNPRYLELLAANPLPSEIDLIFCNSRMAYKQENAKLLPILPAFDHIVRMKTGVGSDGYVLSLRGAQKLLSYYKIDGFYSHLDLRLAAYSLRTADLDILPSGGDARIIRDISILRRIYDQDHHLNSRVLGAALTSHIRGEASSRLLEDDMAFIG